MKIIMIGPWLSANCVNELSSLTVCEIVMNINSVYALCLVQSKKRGLSLEEKREKMLQIFYESQDFFLVITIVYHFVIAYMINCFLSSIM